MNRMDDPKSVPGADVNDSSADDMMFAVEQLIQHQALNEQLLKEREATKVTLDALMREKEELQRELNAKNEELLELRQSGQNVRDKVAKIRIRLEEGSTPR